ncbi:MAG: hypothetical protein ACPL4K_05840, partial [Candidatus Margulisiibacteriota bacterium]
MPVVPMEKVAIFGHKNQREDLYQYLQKTELIEITPTPLPHKETLEEINYEPLLVELKASIDFLDSLFGKKKNFIETFAPSKEIVSEETLIQTFREFNWKEIVQNLKSLEARLTNLKNLETKLKSDIEFLTPWQPLDLNLNQLSCLEKICVTAGICKIKDFELLKNKIEKFTSTIEIQMVNTLNENYYLLVFYFLAEEKIIGDLLSKSNFQKAILPISERTVKDEISFLQKTLRETLKEQDKILEELRSLFKHRAKLTYVHDYLLQKNCEKQAKEKAATTEKTFILSGWLPKKHLPKLKSEISRLFALCEVKTILPEKGEIPPTLIENPKVFYPFELITRIFGLPGQKEMDPT